MKKKLLISSLVILGVILAFYALSALTFRFIFPANGYLVTTTTDSPSMSPLMKGNTLIFESKNIPFEELKVGDIIVYRKPVGLYFFHTDYRSNWGKKDEPESTPTPTPLYKASWFTILSVQIGGNIPQPKNKITGRERWLISRVGWAVEHEDHEDPLITSVGWRVVKGWG